MPQQNEPAVPALIGRIAPGVSNHRRTNSDPARLLGNEFGDDFSFGPGCSDSPKRMRRQLVERALGIQGQEEAQSESPKRIRSVSPEPAPAPAAEPPRELQSPAPTDDSRQEVECAICCSAMEDPAVGGGCAHHFCLTCLESWAKTKPSCPTCRAPIWSISRDAEFATLIGAETFSSRASRASAAGASRNASASTEDGGSEGGEGALLATPPPSTIKSGIRIFAPAGVTIATNGHGECVVTRVVKGNGFDMAGIHVGDIIFEVNGTTVRDHSQCVEFIERRCRVGDCEITYKPTSAGPLLRMTSAFRSRLPAASLSVSRMASRVRRPSGLVPRGRTSASSVASSSPSASPRTSPHRGRPLDQELRNEVSPTRLLVGDSLHGRRDDDDLGT